MKKQFARKILLPGCIVLFGGLFTIALVYAIYLGVYMGIEAIFYEDVTQTPTDILRAATGCALCIVWFLLALTKIPEVLKATLGVGPFTMLMVIVFFRLYWAPGWALAATVGVAGICTVLIFVLKKPWFYYWATLIALIISVIYSWPQP